MTRSSTENDTSPANCETCTAYYERRHPIIARAIVKHANETGKSPLLVALRFKTRLHKRHLAGLPLGEA